MNSFQYERASDVSAALTARARAGAQYLGGGTNLVDLMREAIEHPDVLVDVTGLSRDIEEMRGGGLRIGAGVKNTAVFATRTVTSAGPAKSKSSQVLTVRAGNGIGQLKHPIPSRPGSSGTPKGDGVVLRDSVQGRLKALYLLSRSCKGIP